MRFFFSSPTVRRPIKNLKKANIKEERDSPFIPISPNIPRGSAVRQSRIIFVVSRKPSLNIGNPTAKANTPASIAFRILTNPPNKVPPSIKLGGII